MKFFRGQTPATNAPPRPANESDPMARNPGATKQKGASRAWVCSLGRAQKTAGPACSRALRASDYSRLLGGMEPRLERARAAILLRSRKFRWLGRGRKRCRLKPGLHTAEGDVA